MTVQTCSTIAALMLDDVPELSIDVLADEILQSKIAERAGARSVCWDCDDLVFLDFDALRIAIQEIPATHDTPKVVCLGVGSVPNKGRGQNFDSAKLAHSLVKRLTQIVDANAVLWHEVNSPLSAGVMDDFQDELDKMLHYLDMQMQVVSEGDPEISENKERSHRVKKKLCDEAAMRKLREHLSAQAAISVPIHATIYVLACTYFFLVPALGTALLSYVLLRDGVDIQAFST